MAKGTKETKKDKRKAKGKRKQPISFAPNFTALEISLKMLNGPPSNNVVGEGSRYRKTGFFISR